MIFYVGIFGIFIQYVQHALKNTCVYQRRARAYNGSVSPNRVGEVELYFMNAPKTRDSNTDMWLASLPLARTCEIMRAVVKTPSKSEPSDNQCPHSSENTQGMRQRCLSPEEMSAVSFHEAGFGDSGQARGTEA